MQSEVNTRNGRLLVIMIIVASLTISVCTIVLFNVMQGPRKLPQQMVRLVLTMILCMHLYRGANWARWVAGVLFGLAGLGALLAGFAAETIGLSDLLLIGMGVIYTVSAHCLLFFPSVRAHFGVK